MDEKQYIKGFNNGYLLAKHEPELAAQIIANPNDHNEYFKGFVGGAKEHEKEIREWTKSFSKGVPEKDDKDIQKDR